MYHERGQKYDAQSRPELQWETKRAWNLCEAVIKIESKSRAASQARRMQAEIEMSSLELKIEEVVLPKAPIRIRIDYKNLDKVYFRVYRVDHLEEYPSRRNELRSYLAQKSVLRSWEQTLTQPGDYQRHSTEIAAEALGLGKYMILASSDPSLEFDQGLVAHTNFQVSRIGYYSRNGKEGTVLQLHDRETSRPLAKVSTDLYEYQYDYQSQTGEYKRIKKGLKSDAGGKLVINQRSDRYRQMVMLLQNGDDQLESGQVYSYRYRDSRELPQEEIFFFLDRKIYRPGQTIYFKGMALRRKNKEWKIVKNKNFEVVFRDVNGQEVATQKLRANEFGTFHGSFTAPTGVLTGMMRLYCQNSNVSFRVEEYKRPKFEVKMEPFEGEFRLGEQITVKGSAQTYSGVKLDGAKVSYRVVRTARFPYFYSWWRPSPSSPQAEIADGELITDADGKFQFPFPALADESVPRSDKPIFSYQVNITVTDITGETHEATTSVQAGYTSLVLDWDLPKETDEQKPITSLQLNNLNGQAVSGEVQLQLYELSTPKDAVRKRPWP
ncbi:MAG: MG2 domain-containing protein, partial [Bacteroidota bacterium]